MALLNGEVARVTASFLYKGSDVIQNTWHLVKVSGANANSDIALAAREHMTVIYNAMQSIISEEMTYDYVDVFLLPTAEALGQFAWITLTVGGATGDVTAPGVSLLSLARTGISRRVGKKYFGAMSESAITDGVWTGAAVTAVAAAALLAYQTFTASNSVALRAIVWDRVNAVARDAETLVVDNIPAYQRRRRQGVGV